ncbi:MAG: SIMPL domain-containing protein [Gemmatimonadota bacterium]|nr:SIMPL domain-containing protein [Gemmatimonadota bacterium]
MRLNTVAGAAALLVVSGSTISRRSAAQGSPVPAPIVATSGRGELHIAPDRAIVQIAIESRAPSASAAAGANASATASVLAALRAAGLRDADLSTTGFTVGTDYMRQVTAATPSSVHGGPTRQAPIIFLARNGVRTSVRTVANLGRIIDAALAAGATSIGRVQFTSDGTEKARSDALALAVQHARADAEVIARAAGGSLGPVVELTTLRNDQGATYYDIGIAESAFSGNAIATQLASGDVPIVVTVVGRWRFAPDH